MVAIIFHLPCFMTSALANSILLLIAVLKAPKPYHSKKATPPQVTSARPIPKLMRWGASDVHFVRPVHTVTLLLGDKVIPATILGIQSDRVIRGHRFMGEPEFTIDNAF